MAVNGAVGSIIEALKPLVEPSSQPHAQRPPAMPFDHHKYQQQRRWRRRLPSAASLPLHHSLSQLLFEVSGHAIMKLYWIYHFSIKSRLSQLNSPLVHASAISQSHIEESSESVSALVTVLVWFLLLRASWYLGWILPCSDIFSIYQVYKNLPYLRWFYTLIGDYFL